MIGQSDKLRVKKISDLVYQASRKIRILGFLNWPLSVRYRFFRSGSQQVPEVEYPKLDSTYAKEHLRAAKQKERNELMKSGVTVYDGPFEVDEAMRCEIII